MTRREVIGTASAFAAASYSRVLGANDRLSIGLIGCGGRGGRELLPVFTKVNGPFTAVCDLWRPRADGAAANSPGAKIFGDHRRLLELPGLDAVVVATSDHWHAPIAIDAMNAGKDVYVEKPLTLKMEEGPRIIKAARVNRRICQVGTQQRSGAHYIQARDEYVRSGKLGKIMYVRTWWADGGVDPLASGGANPNPPKAGGGHSTPPGMENKPTDLNWDRYLAPVRWREWNPPQFFNFRAYRDFSGGILTDKFVHWVDTVHMFMGEDGPSAANMNGGIWVAKDSRSVPDTLHLQLEYPGNWLCTFTNVATAGMSRVGIEFCGTHGHLRIDRDRAEYFPPEKGAPPVVVECHTDIVEEHVRNFIESCRSGKAPNCDVAAGHRSAQAAHLGNLSYAEKRRIHFDPDREIVL
ncbi:MAG TPA: Gfo/Idh/MocA family oxidoreductase [Bryobacteraceae bacterium]|jgi:predicted dehydrogenase